ncbi:RING finger protein 39 [Oryzias melastigma]|uniref:RING finger protein 39 n=1 Tax=Oryzias melastigma TaxID=30732 RepID=UPI000CF81633|nr:RING finger protein 39 [Oryzias melastigma]
MQHPAICPACGQECETPLILPCSHSMCSRCVAAGGPMAPPLSVCSLLCPCCGRHVELPCWSWGAATSCLPKHPSMESERVSRQTSFWDDSPEDRPHHAREGAAHACSDCAATSAETPLDGAAELQEEEMERSVFGLFFSLDPSSVPPSLHLSSSRLSVSRRGDSPPPQGCTRFAQVCSDVVIARGQYYWEVDVCNSSIYRLGVSSLDGCSGWWLQRNGVSFSAVYDGYNEPVYSVPPGIKTIGVFLNLGGGALSFHNPLTQEHLATLPTRFQPAGVRPALGLGEGRLKVRCGLSPPPHVFLCKDSAYRASSGPSRGWWCKDVPFLLVKRAVQKFETLALLDSSSIPRLEVGRRTKRKVKVNEKSS